MATLRFVCCVILICACGCRSVLVSVLDTAPNECCAYRYGFSLFEGHVWPGDLTQEFCVCVAPDVRIWVGVIEPCACLEPTATVVVLHGVLSACSRSPGNAMLKMAQFMAANGYRAVLVDFRGHGRSTGSFTTAGLFEACDTAKVLDELERRGLLTEQVGVVGHSQGAGAALLLAAFDARIDAIVAVATPLRARCSVPHFAYTVVPFTRCFFSDADFQFALDRLGERHGFNADDNDTSAAISKLTIPVFLINGQDDAVAPPELGLIVQRASGGKAPLHIVPGLSPIPTALGHSRLLRDDSGIVKGLAFGWFSEYLH